MKSLDEIKRLSREELIIYCWEAQQYNFAMKVIKNVIIQKNSKFSCILIEGLEGCYSGKVPELLNSLMIMMKEICESTGLKFSVILTDVLSNIKEDNEPQN